MKVAAETGRLILRELNVEDAEDFFQLNSDDEVIRYTGDTPFPGIDHARKFLAAYDHYKLYGFGRWAVETIREGEFMGWCGLKYSPEFNEHDVGFRFFRKYWGRGFATEAARACIELGFSQFNIPVIYGKAVKENVASVRVLEKCGMKFSHFMDFHGMNGVVYSISQQ